MCAAMKIEKRAHWPFYWPKYACINLADVLTVNLLVHGTCLDKEDFVSQIACKC